MTRRSINWLIITLTSAGFLQGPTTAPEQPPGLLLEGRSAEALGLGIGDTVYVSSLSSGEAAFVVAGTYRRPADPSTVTVGDHRAILHLPDLQLLLGGRDRVDRFSVSLKVGADREAVMASVDRLAFGAEAHRTEEVANATAETFRVVSRFHRALAGITIIGSSVFLLCLVVLKVEERRLEGAAMREIGLSRRTLFLWTFSEAIAMAMIGTLAGLFIGWAGSGIINLYFRNVYDTTLAFARVTPGLAIAVAIIGALTGVVIGILTGWQMVRSTPSRLREP